MIIQKTALDSEPAYVHPQTIPVGTVFLGVLEEPLMRGSVNSTFLRIHGHIIDLVSNQLYGCGSCVSHRASARVNRIYNYKGFPNATLSF